MTILALGSFLVYPIKEAFAPIVWNAHLTASPTSGHKSKRVSLDWSTTYGTSCTPERLMVRYNKDSTPPDPTKPLDGTLLKYLDTDESSTQHNLLRAATDYAYTIYACEGSSCLTICTDTTNESYDTTTHKEKWLITGVRGLDQDTGARILGPVDWPDQAGPETYRFGTGTTHSGKVAIYFHGTTTTANEPHSIYVVHSDGTSWLDDWNDTTEWGTPVQLASGTSEGDHDALQNVMVVPTQDASSNERIRLFWTSTDSTTPTYQTLNSALSTDEDGDDFALCCDDYDSCLPTTTCGNGEYDDVCCNFDDTDADVSLEYTALDGNCLDMIGWHGHDLWDDMGPVWDPTSDELSILFSGEPYNGASPCLDCDPSPGEPDGGADVDMWRWDTGGGCDTGDSNPNPHFCLEEELETEASGTSICPDEKVVDAHDPFAVAYLDETKVYRKVGQERWIVGYSTDNGRSFEDTSAVEFYFEDGDTGDTGDTGLAGDLVDHACVEDPSSLIWKNGTYVRELMVLVPQIYLPPEGGDPEVRCFCTQDTDVDYEDQDFEAFSGLLSAILVNG